MRRQNQLNVLTAIYLQSCENTSDILGPNAWQTNIRNIPLLSESKSSPVWGKLALSGRCLALFDGQPSTWRWLRTKDASGCPEARARLPIKWQIKMASPCYHPLPMKRGELLFLSTACAEAIDGWWECQLWIPGLIVVLLLNEVSWGGGGGGLVCAPVAGGYLIKKQ